MSKFVKYYSRLRYSFAFFFLANFNDVYSVDVYIVDLQKFS